MVLAIASLLELHTNLDVKLVIIKVSAICFLI